MRSSGKRMVVLLVLLVAGAVVSPDAYWFGLLTNLLLLAVAALGLDLLVGWAGQFSLAVGALFFAGSYIQAILTGLHDVDHGIALILTGTGTTVLSVALGLAALRISGFVYALLTVFVALLIPNVILTFESVTAGGRGITVPDLGIATADLGGPLALYVVASVVLFSAYGVQNLVLEGRLGIRFRTLAHSEVALAASGHRPAVVKFIAFALSGVFVGIAGGVQAHYLGYVGPGGDMLEVALLIFLAIVIGGQGSLAGPLLGTFLIFGLPELLTGMGESRVAVYASALLVVTAFLPGGLISLPVRRWTAKLRPAVGDPAPAAVRPGSGRLQLHPSAPPEQLAVDSLWKRFDGVTAVAGVSLMLHPGEVLGIVGPNGSGKSTLLNLITGVYAADDGHVRLGDVSLDNRPDYGRAQAGVARTFQVPALPLELTGWRAVAVGVRLPRGGGKAERRVRDMLSELGLSELADQQLSTIPHGQRRLLEIARALLQNPRYVLLDEPMAGLDEDDAARVTQLVRAATAQGLGFAVVEHHLDWVAAVADRVVVLDSGAVAAVGTPDEVAPVVDRIVRGRGLSESITPHLRRDEQRHAASDRDKLVVSEAAFGYGGIPVLRDVSMVLEPGKLVGLVGPNGAGKSTLCRGLAGQLPAAAGRILHGGDDVTTLSEDSRARRGIVHVPEGRRLFSRMTVLENLRLGFVGSQMPTTEQDDEVERVLTMFPVLRERLHVTAASLSGGQQQMLALSQALVAGPSVLLIDEPTLGLSEGAALTLWDSLRALAEGDIALLIADEEEDRLVRDADICFRLDRGRLRSIDGRTPFISETTTETTKEQLL